jgi:hypothetical protein
LLQDASHTWRIPPEPDLEAMWSRVEREALGGRTGRVLPFRSPSWRGFAIGIAASLVLGVGLGRLTMRSSPAVPAVASVANDTAVQAGRTAYDRAASDLLGKTAVLLTALPNEGESAQGNMRFSSQALELLTTTRLLLDSPAAADDVRFRDLLEDLELVLAQVASLRPARARGEIEIIADALEERDMVPRIRSAVARLSSGDD